MVDSGRKGRARPIGDEVIATASKRKKRPPRRPAARGGLVRGTGSDRQPLGEGVGDGFALDRLAAPARLRRPPGKLVRELGWAAFGEVVRSLSAKIAESYRPAVIVGVAKGGVFVGGALAA
ncbi:MAG TPA: phosphoribosyltransferase, partial [Anaeromyxobacteraceae bacterium]|nr:phosphoribosyltransferase [Anaeromyxobacteraceae bacterium]